MKRIIGSLLRQLLFWMLFFAAARLLFMIYHRHFISISGATAGETAAVFFHALRLDLATASYFLILPFLLLAVQAFVRAPFLNVVNKIYTGLMILLYTLITTAELGLYGEWKTKLNAKAIRYLDNPSEIYNSADTGSFYLLVVITIVLAVGGYWIYQRYFYKNPGQPARNKVGAAAFFLITPPLLLLGVRGGWQEIPINQSQSYFSHHIVLNHAATNNAFNLYISLHENAQSMNANPYAFYDEKTAKATVDSLLHVSTDTTLRVLNTTRPNIVMLIMESWSADLIESLGGKPGITPRFHQLEKDGILFTGLLSSGSRSEQGMASLFGGFPAHPLSSITVQPDKFIHLPSLVKDIENQGYHTAFYFGGQLIYGNIRGYILYNGFDRITEGADFPDDAPRGKLGVHDEYTLNYLLNDLNKAKEPFFSALFTLSSHSPYDQPMQDVLHWGDNEQRYINSAYYADSCLGDFLAKAKKQPWYKNTLFVIVADHSHNSYRNWPYHTIEYHRIPMLWTGGAISDSLHGSRWSKHGSQVDVAASLLAQMNLPADEFRWSRNLFNPYAPDYRYFGFDNGLIWEDPQGAFCFDCDTKSYFWTRPKTGLDNQVITRGKSYLQRVFRAYFDY